LCSTERGGWVNPQLCAALLSLQRDPRFHITVEMVQDVRPVEHARNVCIVSARASGADVCVQIDNDNIPPANFADILGDAASTGKAVVALPYAVMFDGVPGMIPADNGLKDGQFRQTGCAGAGVLIINAEVWRVIPRGPWFRWLTNDDETGSRRLGEDYFFCELVRQHGLTAWTHQRVAGHLKTTDITAWTLKVQRIEANANGGVLSIEQRYPPVFVAD
jgi:hypothetical protein